MNIRVTEMIIILLLTEVKCNPDFKDENGEDCRKYLDQKYCTTNGEQGVGWTPTYPIHSFLNKKGESPLACPQCGCKLGNIILFY